MKAVLLIAGIGSRIRPLTDNQHKSLLPVSGKAILHRMLENIVACGITDVIAITGYRQDDVIGYIKKEFPQINLQTKTNEKYTTTNTGFSLLLAKELIGNDDFIKFDADVVFEKAILEKLIASPHRSALCLDKNIHLDAEEVKAITDDQGNVLQVGKKIDPLKATGESIGIEKISSEAGIVLFAELEALLANPANYQEYYDDTYTTLVAKGVPFGAVDITGLKWVETDTHADYALANSLFSL